LYEFLTGLPPFCDETVEQIFENILKGEISWPGGEDGEESLTLEAVSCINDLLCRDPTTRCNFTQLKTLPLFQVSTII